MIINVNSRIYNQIFRVVNLTNLNNIALMFYIKKSQKHNIKKEFIYYKKEIDSLNILIEVVIKFDNKLY